MHRDVVLCHPGAPFDGGGKVTDRASESGREVIQQIAQAEMYAEGEHTPVCRTSTRHRSVLHRTALPVGVLD